MKILITVLVVLLLVLQYQLWFHRGSIRDMVRLKHEITMQKAENLKLQHRNQILSIQINDLQKGYQTLESHARHDLGMIKKGETYYQIIRKNHENTH